jgi:N-acetylglutamate synthase-like GNAT family acetyltransferase
MALAPVTPDDIDDVRLFLHEADLTLAGLDAPSVRLWVDRDAEGVIVGSTGFELSLDGAHALIRSVAVTDGRRAAGATRTWLFSRRSGPFWQKLGFVEADRDELAAVLPETQQVRLFVETGQLEREVAWSRELRGSVG